MKTIEKILHPVSLKYGSPMGRPNKGVKPDNKRVYDCRVDLSQGYDKHGVYWGIGSELRVSYTKDLEYIEFYRR